MRGGEYLSRKAGKYIIELVLIRRDEAFLLAVKGVEYVKCRAAYIVIVWLVGRGSIL